MEFGQTQANLSQWVNAEALLGRLVTPSETAPNLESEEAIIPLPFQISSQTSSSQTIFEEILDLLTQDVLQGQHRVLSLNPGRRSMIERRLEYIARKQARMSGEKFSRPVSLDEIGKDYLRSAWESFAAEAAFYNMLELYFLKSLNFYGWREFDPSDLGKLNFAAHSFLTGRGTGFAHDKYCWNFVRSNVYSWYVPTPQALSQLSRLIEASTDVSWSDLELQAWLKQVPRNIKLEHLDFGKEFKLAQFLLKLIEEQLGIQFVHRFQGQIVSKKLFIPAMETGATALLFLEKLLSAFESEGISITGGHLSESSSSDLRSQLGKSIWGCESESIEVYWLEVMSLLKCLRVARTQSDLWQKPSSLCRIPNLIHVVQLLGLELHNLDQLPLNGPEVLRVHQGSAGQIQQFEAFDLSIVTDHFDRLKSGRWMKALSEQLPHWHHLVGSSTNLNWGELHLALGLSKLKEGGTCVYLSHRTLPEGGDGERLRKHLLGMSTLEYFIQLEDDFSPYRYLYVFRKTSLKNSRDQHKPKFGKIRENTLNLKNLEEACTTQIEIAERGWDHMYVRGAAPLVRHLNHKFPKLFQLATVQNWTSNVSEESSLFSISNNCRTTSEPAAIAAKKTSSGMHFEPAREQSSEHRVIVFPHNPSDLPWITSLLNSSPVQFWIRQELLLNGTAPKNTKLTELRSAPVLDFTHASSDLVHEALSQLGQSCIGREKLREWACDKENSFLQKQAKFIALSRRYYSLEKLANRYLPLFHTEGAKFELRADAVSQFYPAHLMVLLCQYAEAKIQYIGRDRTQILPEYWSVEDCHTVFQDRQEGRSKPTACVIVSVRQGSRIQITVPVEIGQYLQNQIKLLTYHTWGEVLTLLRVPRDITLYSAQVSEISRVVFQTLEDMKTYWSVLDDLSLDLFEIPSDLRQFLIAKT